MKTDNVMIVDFERTMATGKICFKRNMPVFKAKLAELVAKKTAEKA